MPLRFLVPAFLLGLTALVVPILVHLTRRQKARAVEFPSLMFLQPIAFRAESRKRIEHWLLFLLRALALTLIVAAFSRPFIAHTQPSAAGSVGPREVVMVVDRSYSMAAEGRWEGALSAARERIRGLRPLDRASVVFFARSAFAAARSETDPSRLLASLDTARVSDASTSYGPALRLAQTILEESELPARELVLISDFQRAGWTGEEGVRLPEGTLVTPVPLFPEGREDRAIAGVDLDRRRAGSRDRVTVTARLARSGGTAEAEAEVVLEVEGVELERRTVRLPPEGGASVTFEPFVVAREHTRGAVHLAGEDELPADDLYAFVLSPRAATRVVIVEPGGASSTSSLFMREALAVAEDQDFAVSVRRGVPEEEELEGVSVVILNDVALRSPSDAAVLRRFVERGGGLLLVAGERAVWPATENTLLPGTLGEPRDHVPGRGERVGYVDDSHPIFEIFRAPRSGDLSAARFFRSRSLEVGAEAGSVLARFSDGFPALAERKVGEGRVLLWTSTMDGFWNDLVRHPVFVPFFHRLIRYTSNRPEVVPSLTVGETVELSDPDAAASLGLEEIAEALADGSERLVLTPAGESVLLSPAVEPSFLVFEQRGIYDFRPPGSESARAASVAVNVDIEEADLTPLDVEEVVSAISARPGEDEGLRVERPSARRLEAVGEERRQSWWRLLLLAALGLLVLESIVSHRLSRGRFPGGRRGANVAT